MANTTTQNDLFKSAVMAFASGQYDNSIVLFSRFIDDIGDTAMARVSRGAAYLKKGAFDSARKDFDKAIGHDPEYARAYHLRGLVHEKQGDDRAALADFDRAIEIDPEYGAAWYSRASLHDRREETDAAQADIAMVTHLGNRNMAAYMAENNVWRTEHMRVEDALETELER